MKNRKEFYIWYTVSFILLACGIFFVFAKYGYSFVFKADGLQQHFNALVYYRSWLRDILNNIFIDHKLEIPLWNMNIGYGADVLMTLHYYVIGDPLNLLSIFVSKESYMELFFCGLVIVRMYLAGLAFSIYAFHHKNGAYPVLMGTMVYVFSLWNLCAFKHPYFLNPMIYMPLILLGIDRIFEERKPKLYIGMLAIATISNFYFAYMICILVMVYTVFVYLDTFRKIQFSQILYWVGYFISVSLLALSMAAFLLIPQINAVCATARSSVKEYVPLTYEKKYYLDLLAGFTMGSAKYYSLLGYTAIGTFAVVVLFLKGKKYLKLQLAFVLMTLFSVVPMAGHLFNGGGYVTNRQTWAYTLLVSYIIVKMIPVMQELSAVQRRLLSAFLVGYILLIQVGFLQSSIVKKHAAVILLELIITYFLFFVMPQHTGKRYRVFAPKILVCLLGAELIIQGYDMFGIEHKTQMFLHQNKAISFLTTDSTAKAVKDNTMDDNGFWRYENSGSLEPKNAAMLNKINGTSYFFSVADGNISTFQKEMQLNRKVDFSYTNNDSRMALQAVSNVKYYVVQSNQIDVLSYGYQAIATVKGNQNQEYVICKNQNPLLFGYTCDSYIPQKKFQKLSVDEREQALLQGAVLAESDFPETDLELKETVHDYKISRIDKLKIKGDRIYVKKRNASLEILFQGEPESETHINIQNLHFRKKGKAKKKVNCVQIGVEGETQKKNISYIPSGAPFYPNFHAYTVNLGYSKKSQKRAVLHFQKPGVYRLNLQVVSQPVKAMQANIEKRNQSTLQNVKQKTNRISGTISLAEKKILCLSIPYSKGWSARVDGKRVKVKQSNLMFMALELQPGEHTVELSYRTPYLAGAVCLSCTAWICFLALGHIGKKKSAIPI